MMNVLQGKRDSTAQDGSVQGDAVQNGIVQNGIAQNGESHIIFAEDLAPAIPRSSTALRFWAS